MSAINKFANETEYNAHTKSTTNSEVSLVVTPKDLHYDGLNVENKHKIPAIGDCLYLDSNGKRHFFYGATVNNTKLVNDGYTPVGVVAHKYSNNKVLIVRSYVGRYKFFQALVFKLSNFKINGTANNIKVRWFDSNNVKTVISSIFTESCSSLQDFVTKFDAFLRANQVGSYQWHCELMQIEGNNEACVIIDNYYQVYQYQSVIESGASATLSNYTLGGINNTYRLKRNSGYRWCTVAFINKEYSLYKLSTETNSLNPSDDENTNGFLNKTDFESGNYPTIKNKYKTYENYFNSLIMMTKPCTNCGQADCEDGATICSRLKDITFKNLSGNSTYLFPAIRNCSILTHGGLEWHLIDVNDCYNIFNKLDLFNLNDPINIGLSKLGYSRLDTEIAYTISNVAPSSRESFYYTPNIGQATNVANACYAYRCVPCTILDLN